MAYLLLHLDFTTMRLHSDIGRQCCRYFHFILLVQAAATIHSIRPRNETDYLALVSFKDAITDSTGALRSWNNTQPFCQWHGVSCGQRHEDRVTALALSSMGLSGVIPPSIGNLTFLTSINLSNNKFGGEIPSDIGGLQRLRYLDLGSNSLDGSVPVSLGLATSLRYLDLSNNQLGGIMAAQVAELLNLTYLDVSRNVLVGQIPPVLGQLNALVKLNLSSNNLTGSIPRALGGLSALQRLDLSHNNLSGPIPPFFANLTSLDGFSVSYNNLQGSLPEDIGQCKSLQYIVAPFNDLSGELPMSLYNTSSIRMIELSYNLISGTLRPDIGHLLPKLYFLSMFDNQLGGEIPTSLPNASALQCITLGQNNLVGVVPPNLGELKDLLWLSISFNMLQADTHSDCQFVTSLTNCSKLLKLHLFHNNLRGELPSSVANLSTQLVWLDFAYNQISGTIPAGIGNLARLTSVRFQANNFSGVIPESIGRLTDLAELLMYGNRFSGTIPSSFGNLTKVTELELSENELVGEVPPSLVNCLNLAYFSVGGNRLTGTIPSQIFTISALTYILNLSNNFLDGTIPSEVGRLQNLATLDFSNNRLTGLVPSTIGQCQVLQKLYMDGNLLQGGISSSFGSLKDLVELGLSRNNFSEPFPGFLKDLQYLQLLNLSFNHLSGEVPSSGVFSNATAVYVAGNDDLCGGITDLHFPSCPVHTSAKKKTNKSLVLKMVAPIGSIALSLILVFVFLGACHQKRSSSRQSSSTAPLEDFHRKVSYAELANATNGFSPDNVIGTGSFGSVYRGLMFHDSAETIIAVKVLNLQQRGALKTFVAECEALRHARHRNLLKILTVCASIDSKGDDFKALVFDYMPNGSLERCLHPEFSEDTTRLNLLQRLNVAVDVAAGLDYLHNHCETPIVHCDLKPSNVLLAHVGDFGLVSFLDNAHGGQVSSVAVKGSIGYIAPEYGMGGQVSTSGDVYSYGILLLEMFTGKRPTDEMFRDGLTLARFIEETTSEEFDVMSIVDPSLLGEVSEGIATDSKHGNQSGHGAQKCTISVISIGLSCAKELPVERPDIKDVVNQMVKIRASLCMYEG